MTEKELLLKLIEAADKMRAAQKNFFNTSDKKARQGFLVSAKQYEKEFDNTVFNIKQLVK